MFVCLVSKLRAGTQVYIGHVASIQAAELSWARRFDRSAQQTAALMFTAIISGRVGISGRELLSCAEHLAIIYSQLDFF